MELNATSIYKSLQLSALALTIITTGRAQNMVVNSTFEAKRINGYSELVKANGWSNANGGTADLFDKNKSRKHAVNGIPYNYMGYQEAGDGQNYAGIVAYYDDGTDHCSGLFGSDEGYKHYTEYLQAELREPMQEGLVYQVSFKVSLADNSGRAVSCLGAMLTTDKVKEQNNSFLARTPQFISHRVITDSENWVTLSGAYLAAGGEKYLTMGCFRDEDFMVEKIVDRLHNDSHKAYYYISEVSVTPYVSSKSNLDALVLGVDYAELMNLQFASGSADIKPQFYSELNEVAEWMNNYPGYKFFIAGYTDQQGNDSLNDQLSTQRAEAVKNYLVNKGVKEENLMTEGFGSNNPVEDRFKSRRNRRVEVYLYSVTRLSQL